MASSHLFQTLAPLLLLLLLSPLIQAQTPSAPAPAPAGPINVTAILEKGGQYTTLIKLLTSTQVGNQINTQVNSSSDGMTLFAPTDNAFNNLKSGSLNSLSNQQQVQLVLYHVLSKCYKLSDLLLVSNPVRTQASGNDGGVFGLNFTGQANQVNVSTGIVETQVNNALRPDCPLIVYQLDKVLLPNELFGVKPPAASPTPKTSTGGKNSTKTESSAEEPTSSADNNASGSGKMGVGLGLIAGLAMVCMGALF